MNKNVLKSMFTNIVEKTGLRPTMCGVHFENERCYASDGRLLVVFREGSDKLQGKTVGADGAEIEGRFPNVDAVIPKEREEYSPRVVLRDLFDACQYNVRTEGKGNRVCIQHKTFSVHSLVRVLNVFKAAGEMGTAVLYKSSPDRAAVIESKTVTAVIMPMLHEEELVDSTLEDEVKVYSYESLYNEYAFGSGRKRQDWMDAI